MQVEFEIHGVEQLVRKFGKGAVPIIQAVTRGVAEQVRDAIAKYPGPVRYPIRWASEAQRRAYWAKRRGLGPYVRQSDSFSERLGPSWATETRGQFDALVGTRVSYAPWVQSADRQQPMHAATGWKTDAEAVEEVERSGAAERLLKDALSEW